jgi:hypothetical protein
MVERHQVAQTVSFIGRDQTLRGSPKSIIARIEYSGGRFHTNTGGPCAPHWSMGTAAADGMYDFRASHLRLLGWKSITV